MRALVAAATAGLLGLTAAGLAAGAGSPTAQAGTTATTATSITWGACEDAQLAGVGAECGFVSVPLNWSEPAGQKIQIAVSRLQARENRQGVMLINPGGPGGSGLPFPAFYPQLVPGGIGYQYDWIGFDPRGVGSSRPAISCDGDYFAGPRPAYRPASATTQAPNELAWIARTKAYAKACLERNGELLRHMRSIDTVRDMEAIRIALGEEQINFFGISYGTFLGQAYATEYPDRLRRLILDSNVPPEYPGYGDGGRGQVTGFEYTAGQFFDWIANRSGVYGLGATKEAVEQAFYDQVAELTRQPVGDIGPAEWSDVFLIAGYAEQLWPTLADAWADWAEGNPDRLKFIVGIINPAGNDNSYAAFNATLCTDGPWPSSYAKVRADAFQLEKEVGRFATWGGYWFSGPCTFWPVERGEPLQIDGSLIDIPILVLNATQDGPTPYPNALRVRQEFPTSVLVADVGGMTHGVGLNGNLCVTAIVTEYLLDGSLPERTAGDGADVECERKPLPEPSLIDRGVPTGTLLDAPEPLNSLLLILPVAHQR